MNAKTTRPGLLLPVLLYLMGTGMLIGAIFMAPRLYRLSKMEGGPESGASSVSERDAGASVETVASRAPGDAPSNGDDAGKPNADIALAKGAGVPIAPPEEARREPPDEERVPPEPVEPPPPAAGKRPKTPEDQDTWIVQFGPGLTLNAASKPAVREISNKMLANRRLRATVVGISPQSGDERRATNAARQVRGYIAVSGVSRKRMTMATVVAPEFEELSVRVKLFGKIR